MFTHTKANLFSITVIFAFLSIIAGACGGGGDGEAEEEMYPTTDTMETAPPVAEEILIIDTSFNPDSLRIVEGRQVTWVNNDSIPHTVTSGYPDSQTDMFDSGELETHDSFSHFFNSAGVYRYYCKYHPELMTGVIVVLDRSGTY